MFVYYCQNPTKIHDSKFIKVASSIWSLRTPTAIFGTKNWYNLDSRPSPPQAAARHKVTTKFGSFFVFLNFDYIFGRQKIRPAAPQGRKK